MRVKQGDRTGQKGQVLIMVTLGITFLLGLLGLVVDVGYSYYVKQAAQGAVDAAALAAITTANAGGGYCGPGILCQTGYKCPTSPTSGDDFGVACLYAKTNGFVYGGGQTVTISSGTGVPPTAPGVNTRYWVTATATQQLTLGFLSALGVHGGWVYSQATGAVVYAGTGGCIYVMDPAQSPSMTVAGNGNITSDCGIYVNSSASTALSVNGNATITGSLVHVVGGTQIGSNASVNPTPVTGSQAVADPLANIPAPTFGGCDHTSYSVSGGTVTLSPGVYCGGISISSTTNVTFSPGNYILNGGGFAVSGQATLNGAGVFFYNTASAGYPFGPVLMAGGSSTTLTAPTSGEYQGILFFQDRSITSGAQNTIAGGSTEKLGGSIYMAGGQLVFAGGSSAGPLSVALVVKTLSVTGGSFLKKDATG